MEEQMEKEQRQVVDVQFRPGQKVYFFDPNGLTLAAGDHVIIDTARGAEFGTCASGIHKVDAATLVAPLRPVLRKATARDERILQDNQAREKKAYAFCQEKIAYLGLDMQLVSAECAFDGSKILFFFTADERVDFRELVKMLASAFHTRIELRQIGVRDKAKMVGGLGICGRPFCCSSFLSDFQPVSIKMAKTQNLSLNPTKISGTCGRLLCCLNYEQAAYEDLIKRSPKAESFVDTPEGRGTITEVELLRSRVKVRMEENPETISTFSIDEIAVLRNGRAKKTDPPIPADLAPISGSGKRPRLAPTTEAAPVLEAIRFRYSTDTIAEEQAEEQESVAEPVREPKGEENRNKRRRNNPRKGRTGVEPSDEMPKPEKKQPQNKPKKPAEGKPRKQEGQKQGRPKQDRKAGQDNGQNPAQGNGQNVAQGSPNQAGEGEAPRAPRGENRRPRRPYNRRPRNNKTEGSGE